MTVGPAYINVILEVPDKIETHVETIPANVFSRELFRQLFPGAWLLSHFAVPPLRLRRTG